MNTMETNPHLHKYNYKFLQYLEIEDKFIIVFMQGENYQNMEVIINVYIMIKTYDVHLFVF